MERLSAVYYSFSGTCAEMFRSSFQRRTLCKETDPSLDWIPWLGSFLSGLVLLYFLAAPPIVIGLLHRNGDSYPIPAIYHPVGWIIDSGFGGPLF